MTNADLVSRALDNVSTPRPQLGPLTLLVLSAVLTAAIEHYVEKCLDRLDGKTLRSPGPVRRWQHWRVICGITTEHDGEIGAAGRKEVDQLAYDALLKMSAGLTDGEVHAFLGARA